MCPCESVYATDRQIRACVCVCHHTHVQQKDTHCGGHDLAVVDLWLEGLLLKVTVATGVQQPMLGPVFLWIQHVVASLCEALYVAPCVELTTRNRRASSCLCGLVRIGGGNLTLDTRVKKCQLDLHLWKTWKTLECPWNTLGHNKQSWKVECPQHLPQTPSQRRRLARTSSRGPLERESLGK